MAVLLLLLALIIVAVLAVRYGYDSRELVKFQSKEQELACFGMQWPEFQGLPLARPIRRLGLGRRLRRALARKLLALADWLAPGTPARLNV